MYRNLKNTILGLPWKENEPTEYLESLTPLPKNAGRNKKKGPSETSKKISNYL